MKDIDLNKLKDLAIKAAAGSFPVPVAYEQPRIYSDAEISYLTFVAAVTPAAFLTIVNDLQTEVAAKQQNVDYLADRIPETQHNGMMQLSHQLEEVQALLRHTQEKLGKALSRNSEYAGEMSRRDAAAGEPVAWQFLHAGDWHTGSEKNNHRRSTEAAGYQVRNLYTAAQPAVLPWKFKECHHCESKSLTWDNTVRTRSGVQDGLLKANEMTGLFYLGCDECSETLAQIKSDDVADFLNLLQNGAPQVLGCQPVPVVKLPARFKPKVSSLLGNHAAIMASNSDGGWVNLKGVIEALDASGIKWEVEHETSD